MTQQALGAGRGDGVTAFSTLPCGVRGEVVALGHLTVMRVTSLWHKAAGAPLADLAVDHNYRRLGIDRNLPVRLNRPCRRSVGRAAGSAFAPASEGRHGSG